MKDKKRLIAIDDKYLAEMTAVLDTLEDTGGGFVHIVLNQIGTLIIGNYEFAINVLPTLRSLFPGYEWFSIERGYTENWHVWMKRLGEAIKTSDFFWRGERNHYDLWVIARKKNLDTRRCVYGNGFIEQTMDHDDVIKLLREVGAQEVWPHWAGDTTNLFPKDV